MGYLDDIRHRRPNLDGNDALWLLAEVGRLEDELQWPRGEMESLRSLVREISTRLGRA